MLSIGSNFISPRGQTLSVFKDKIAIITGAGSGIGRALAEELATRGAQVVICDINSERIEEVGKQINDNGGSATALTVDVTDAESVKRMVNDTVAAHGKIDLIFNNAGIVSVGEARDFSMEDWKRVIDVNIYGVINGVQSAYPVMIEQGFGHIVNTSSILGLIPIPMMISYVASKHAIVGLSNALRIEAEPLGVKVSVVCPGDVGTSIHKNAGYVNVDINKVESLFSNDRSITPEQCAKAILRGVERNKPIIVITWSARLMWAIYRLSPRLFMWLTKLFVKRMGSLRKDD